MDKLRLLGAEIPLRCSPQERRRLEDLARALEQRLAGFQGDPQGMQRLALTALALMDEAQAAGAALARARSEIDRLTDLIVEAKLEAPAAPALDPSAGSVAALRRTQGAA